MLNRTASPLTERECEVLELLAQGRPTKGIARELEISERTVDWHVMNARRALGASSRTEAVARAMNAGYLRR